MARRELRPWGDGLFLFSFSFLPPSLLVRLFVFHLESDETETRKNKSRDRGLFVSALKDARIAEGGVGLGSWRGSQTDGGMMVG